MADKPWHEVYPPPWKIVNEFEFVGILADNDAVVHDGRFGLNFDAMKRIVDCVNLLEGVPDYTVENGRVAEDTSGHWNSPDWCIYVG